MAGMTAPGQHPDGNDRFLYCPRCGAELGFAHRGGRERLVCRVCHFVFYQNPNVGVAAIIVVNGAVLLTQRGGSVARGKWELPGGFVEYNEDIRDALVREIREKTGLTIEVGRVFDARSNFFEHPASHSVGVWFLARRISGTLRAGDDAIDARFFPLDELPPDEEIAFPTDRAVLAALRAERPPLSSEPGAQALLRDEAALWPRLVAELDAAGEGAALHDAGEGAGATGWTARDV